MLILPSSSLQVIPSKALRRKDYSLRSWEMVRTMMSKEGFAKEWWERSAGPKPDTLHSTLKQLSSLSKGEKKFSKKGMSPMR